MSNPLNANDIDMIVENDERLQYGRRRDGMVFDTAGVLTWEAITSICPLPAQVEDGVPFGDLIGKYGRINTDDPDISSQISALMLYQIKKLYPELTDLTYLEDLEKNSFKGNNNRVGIRELDLQPTNEKIQRETVSRTYEIIITNDFVNKKDVGDVKQREAKKELIDKMELIRRNLGNRGTKAGGFKSIRIVRDQYENEVEYLDAKSVGVAVIKSEITVNFTV